MASGLLAEPVIGPATSGRTRWLAPGMTPCLLSSRHISIDYRPRLCYEKMPARSRDVTGDGRLTERVRFLRAELVTPFSGGSGIVPSGTMTGARGAPLKRDRRRR